MTTTSQQQRADYLRSIDQISEPDPRSDAVMVLGDSGLRAKTIADQHAAVGRYVLGKHVPERVRIVFETCKNLYLYAWFVYRFYAVCRTCMYSCLELALRERFGQQLHAIELKEQADKDATSGTRRRGRRVPQAYEKYRPGLKRLISFAAAEGHIRKEGFEAWRIRDHAQAVERVKVEALARESGAEIRWDEDTRMDFVATLVNSIPEIRNEFAHGTFALDSSVLGSLRNVYEIIDQIYRAHEE
jgi:hypothetical protein